MGFGLVLALVTSLAACQQLNDLAPPARTGGSATAVAAQGAAVEPAVATSVPQAWSTLDGFAARRVAAVVAYLDAYDAGRLADALALLGDGVRYDDCDYARGELVSRFGRDDTAIWLRARLADHDRLALDSVGAGHSLAVAVRVRRGSDTLRRLGVADSLAPRSTGKWVVTPVSDGQAITQVMLADRSAECVVAP